MIVAALFVIAIPAGASTSTVSTTIPVFPIALSSSTASTSASTTPIVSFCDNVDVVTSNIRTDATLRAADHRIQLEKLSSEREGEKKKLNEVRAEVRLKEDIAREYIIDLFRSKATTAVAKEAVEYFSSSSSKILRELRESSDKAREDYAKVIRNVSLAERTKRNKALDSYIDKLDAANDFAEEQCAKGAKDTSIIAAYNIWLKSAKEDLAKNLKLKKSTLEQRAKEVHERELTRLEADYQRKLQKEIILLTDKFPELILFPEPLAATNTPKSI